MKQVDSGESELRGVDGGLGANGGRLRVTEVLHGEVKD